MPQPAPSSPQSAQITHTRGGICPSLGYVGRNAKQAVHPLHDITRRLTPKEPGHVPGTTTQECGRS